MDKDRATFISNMFFFFFVVILGSCFCSEESTDLLLEHPIFSGPSEALAKKSIDFNCEIPNPKNQSILLQIFKRGEYDSLLGEYTLLKGEEVAVIPKVIKPIHEGYLECVARVQNNSEISPTVSNAHYLKVIEPVKDAKIILSGPTELYEGHSLELQCQLKAGNHATYKWLHNNQTISPTPFIRLADDQLVITRVTSKHNGSYVCEASNVFNDTNVFEAKSPEIVITVKDLVSTPDISISVSKEKDQDYFAIVKCQSTRGTFPIRFSLYNYTNQVSNVTVEEKEASFKLPVVLNQHLGWLQCQANNGEKTSYSPWAPLEIVPVAAPVVMEYKYEMTEYYAVIGLWLHCKPAKGSHPQFQWYHNNIPINDRRGLYEYNKESFLWLPLWSGSAGRYHCQVSDSFDNITSISSPGQYFDKKVINRLPNMVVLVVFGCFTVLILLVSFCCLLGVVFRRRYNKDKSLLNLEMEMDVTANELDLSDYEEDPSVTQTTKEDEFDQKSDISVDEWYLIEPKETLQDKSVQETF